MKMDSVNTNLNFGARGGYLKGAKAKIAKQSTPHAIVALAKTFPALKKVGEDGTVRHLIGHAGGDQFNLVTQVKKHQGDAAPAIVLKAKSLTTDKLEEEAKKLLEAAQLAIQHHLTQKDVDKVGVKYLSNYVKLGAFEE